HTSKNGIERFVVSSRITVFEEERPNLLFHLSLALALGYGESLRGKTEIRDQMLEFFFGEKQDRERHGVEGGVVANPRVIGEFGRIQRPGLVTFLDFMLQLEVVDGRNAKQNKHRQMYEIILFPLLTTNLNISMSKRNIY
ncbi:hypothetical protein AVEN_220343-1, partial [Araneus ventricosus]